MSLPRAATTFTSLGFTDNVNVASTIHWDLGFKGFQLRCLLHAICVHTLSLVGSHCLVGAARDEHDETGENAVKVFAGGRNTGTVV